MYCTFIMVQTTKVEHHKDKNYNEKDITNEMESV